MKKKESVLGTLGLIALITLILLTVGVINYELWRAEHPNAKTWTFFLHNNNR